MANIEAALLMHIALLVAGRLSLVPTYFVNITSDRECTLRSRWEMDLSRSWMSSSVSAFNLLQFVFSCNASAALPVPALASPALGSALGSEDQG